MSPEAIGPSNSLPSGVDPIRLNLFFDLLFALTHLRDFDSLGEALGKQLRFVVDFDQCYLISGDPMARPMGKVYISTRKAPRAVISLPGEARAADFEAGLLTCPEGEGVKSGGKVLCLPLISPKGILGELILMRDSPFQHSEYRFAEAIRGYLSQMLHDFANTEELKHFVQKLEDERELRERFVSALTHDLRTPLTAVKLLSQLLIIKSKESDAVQALSLRINSNVDRIDRMIRDLLDADRIKAGEGIPINVEACKLDPVIAAIVQDLNQIFGPWFLIDNETKGLHGFWDPSGIQRILENLASNAIKYGKFESPVIIRLKSGSEWVEISVHNDGEVVSTEDQKTLFNQYRRTQSAIGSEKKGWGIGLTLVKAIAKAHRGSVRVESSRESGTTFYVRLAIDARKKPD